MTRVYAHPGVPWVNSLESRGPRVAETWIRSCICLHARDGKQLEDPPGAGRALPRGGGPRRRRRRARPPVPAPRPAPDELQGPRGARGGHGPRDPGARAGAGRGLRLPDAGHERRRVPARREGALPGRPARAPHRAGRLGRHRGGGQPLRDLPLHLEALGREPPAAHRPGRHRPVLDDRGEPAAPGPAHRPAGGAGAAQPRPRRQAGGPHRGAPAGRPGVAHLLRRHRRPARHHPRRVRGGARQRRLRAPPACRWAKLPGLRCTDHAFGHAALPAPAPGRGAGAGRAPSGTGPG